jgi:hypothetical protein
VHDVQGRSVREGFLTWDGEGKLDREEFFWEAR